MAFIKYLEFESGSTELQQAYSKYGSAAKHPANIIRISGVNPLVLEQHVNLYRSIMYGQSPLSRRRREVIAIVVSALNKCHY